MAEARKVEVDGKIYKRRSRACNFPKTAVQKIGRYRLNFNG